MARNLGSEFDARRLRLLLLLFFLALALPTGALIWQAYGQLKWEAFYQYRVLAEELGKRIDAALIEHVDALEAHGFGDYAFLIDAGTAQRSPLSAFPVAPDFPGVVGYFQVDSDGRFSTPLLPRDDNTGGIGADELRERRVLARKIQSVLADNRLIRARDVRAPALAGAAAVAQADTMAGVVVGGSAAGVESRARSDLDAPAAASPGKKMPAAPQAASKAEAGYSQQVFDQLNSTAGARDKSATRETDGAAVQRAYGKLADLKLDATLEKKSTLLERESSADDETQAARQRKASNAPARRLEPGAPKARDNAEESVAPVVIRTFAGEIDPFEFSLLDSGHLVLFRKVWRDGERFIQGLLIDPGVFVHAAIEEPFRPTLLAGMSELVLAYQDDVIGVLRGQAQREATGGDGLQGTLLYRNRLSAPLDGLELVFSINRLPAGAGAGVLGWISVLIGLVLCGGFAALYRLGIGQIRLARQQQDFVSAVSHELKTPLTSIRMYGEMLREGWVAEDKRQQYYQYIHDESERLTRLISNVLQLARISRNEPQFDRKPHSVGELLSQIESKTASAIARAGFELRIARDERSARALLEIDADCFAQIIINLVDNAIKFSRNAPLRRIEIGCGHASDNMVCFTVRDHGPGIAKDQLRRIFTLFYRCESELTRETVGTGIGLAIVQQLVRAMGGTVDAVNVQPGAQFRVCFPVANA